MKNKTSKLATAIILSLACISTSCVASDTVAIDTVSATESASVTYLTTVDAEKEVAKFTKFLSEVENPKRFQIECDQKNIAKSCYYYASYNDLIVDDRKKSYPYYKKAFDLGSKQAGYFIGAFQINYPETFDNETRLDIDESIYYLEQAFKSGSSDATRFLMMIYRDPELNIIDYDKAEYYNKIAIDQNVRTSRALLASLYMHHMKDKYKINESIDLLNRDLILEKNWESSLILSNIYLNPEEFGIDKNLVKTLAYAYITRDLRRDIIEPRVANVENEVIEILPQVLTPEQLKQAKALYLELMAKMNS